MQHAEGALEALRTVEAGLVAVERCLASLITRPTVQLARASHAVVLHLRSQLSGSRAIANYGEKLIPVNATAVAVSASAAEGDREAGPATLPLLTLTIYGLSHYLRWITTAHAYGVRISIPRKAIVATSFLLLPNLLVPLINIQWLHLLLVFVVAANNCFLYREFCIHRQLQLHGHRLPGEPLVMAALQVIDFANELVIGPGQVLGGLIWRYLPQLLRLPPEGFLGLK